MKLSVVIPIYNEERTLVEIVRRVQAVPFAMELVLVNDCSTDKTREIMGELERAYTNVRCFHHEVNQGKGGALRTGFAQVTGDIVLIQDADLEYSPDDYPVLLKPILDGKADVVFGSRFLGGPHRVLYYWHSVVNWFLTTLSNMFTNLNVTDMETCYKVFRADVLKKVTTRQDRFGIEPELVAKVARTGARIYEVPISYAGRTYEEGKKIGWRDGVKALWCVVRYGLFD